MEWLTFVVARPLVNNIGQVPTRLRRCLSINHSNQTLRLAPNRYASLTRCAIGVYIGPVMSKKVIGLSLVAVWIGIFALEILGVSGVLGSKRADMTQSVRTTLATLALAELSQDNTQDEPRHPSACYGEAASFYPRAERSLYQTQVVQASPCLYKLHETFRL